MSLRTIAKIRDVADRKRLTVTTGAKSIGIIEFEGNFYAYENNCPHQGGPVCEGNLFGNVECRVSPQGRKLEEYVSTENVNISCPWHGVEFDVRTGICRSDKRLRLTPFTVVVDGEDLKILA